MHLITSGGRSGSPMGASRSRKRKQGGGEPASVLKKRPALRALRNGCLQRRQRSMQDEIGQRDKELKSESIFAQGIDQRAPVTGTNDDGSARTAQNQGQIRR